jgi:flavin reductase (DIM6/NTAB) family NADH-FMN oxidoreductase RutF
MTNETHIPGTDEALAPDAALETDPLSSEDFRAAFRNHAAGVAVVTADPGDGPVGMTATSVFSVSATPPLLVFSVSDLSSATPGILSSESLVVHLLGADQADIAKRFATSGIDRFADTSTWDRLPTGEPYIPAAHAWIRGTIVNRFSAGTSTLVVVNATDASFPEVGSPAASAEDARPLVYHNRTWHVLGEHSRLD